jgi:hypothetical protein
MGICLCSFCFPPCCLAGTCALSLHTCGKPGLALKPAWPIAGVLALVISVVIYVDMTFRCQAATATWRGQEPLNGTGVRFRPGPGEDHEGEVLVNFTWVDLGYSEERPLSLNPVDYQNSGCYSDAGQPPPYMLNGLASACLMAAGCALLMVSAAVKLLEVTLGSCCGKPIKPPPQSSQAEDLNRSAVPVIGMQEVPAPAVAAAAPPSPETMRPGV